jgi:hypothetical protein
VRQARRLEPELQAVCNFAKVLNFPERRDQKMGRIFNLLLPYLVEMLDAHPSGVEMI